MAQNIYILSNGLQHSCYKVGIHRNNLKKLYSRYHTAIPTLQVDCLIKNVNARPLEQIFLKKHLQKRVIFSQSGRRSEWVHLPLETIKRDFLEMGLLGENGLNFDFTFQIGSYQKVHVGETVIFIAQPEVLN
jgi:hypothetical protein